MYKSALRTALILITALAASQAVAQSKRRPAKPAPAPAAAPVELGDFGAWKAYEVGNRKSKSCFAISRPTVRKPSNEESEATLFVTRRPGEGVKNELSLIVGFNMKDGGTATLRVGRNKPFMLYTKDTNAWVKDATQEASVINAMRGAGELVFEGSTSRGRKRVDQYSLKGVSAALDAITKACP